jgi:hypothetical protein
VTCTGKCKVECKGGATCQIKCPGDASLKPFEGTGTCG